MAKTKRKIKESDQFVIPKGVVTKAKKDSAGGIMISVDPHEVVQRMQEADEALNGDSNDAEHDALVDLREWLSEIFEDTDRRTTI
jgi:hypothetical protein